MNARKITDERCGHRGAGSAPLARLARLLTAVSLAVASTTGCALGNGTPTDDGKPLAPSAHGAPSNGASGGAPGTSTTPGGPGSAGGGDGTGTTGNGGAGSAPDGGSIHVCKKAGLKPGQVVMLGDSYLDPAWADTAVELYADAVKAGALPEGQTYRHYYLGGASMNGGFLQLNIPYQYEQMAMVDDPDIVAIVMDGGGNDVLISDRSCLTQAPPANAGCAKTIDGALGKAREELAKMGAERRARRRLLLLPPPRPDEERRHPLRRRLGRERDAGLRLPDGAGAL